MISDDELARWSVKWRGDNPVPKLIDEVLRLRAENATLKKHLDLYEASDNLIIKKQTLEDIGNEIATMSRAVAQHFRLWTPAEECLLLRHFTERREWEVECACGYIGELRSHEIPCPDLTQAQWAWRLLEKMPKGTSIHRETDGYYVSQRWPVGPVKDNDPREALLRAAYALVQREPAE